VKDARHRISERAVADAANKVKKAQKELERVQEGIKVSDIQREFIEYC
jgi:hypothetical protein